MFGIAVLALSLSGCSILEMVANDAGLSSPSKRVADKAPPNVLVAQDGTTCKVPTSRFDRVRIGQSITCVWSSH